MDDFKLNPANFTPRQNPPKPNTSLPAEALSLPELTELENMPPKALHLLLQRVCGARWGEIAKMDKSAVAEAMRLRLAHIALTAEIKDALIAIEKWLDRTEGKPLQAVDMRGNLNVVTVNANIEFVQSGFQPQGDKLIIDHVDKLKDDIKQ